MEGAEMADEREETDFNRLLDGGKPAGEKMQTGKKKCMMVKPIRKEIQVAAKWMTRSKSDVCGTQQTQGPSPMDHSDSRVDMSKEAIVKRFSYKCLLPSRKAYL